MITYAPPTRFYIKDTANTRQYCKWAIGLEYRGGNALVPLMGDSDFTIDRWVNDWITAEDLEER